MSTHSIAKWKLQATVDHIEYTKIINQLYLAMVIRVCQLDDTGQEFYQKWIYFFLNLARPVGNYLCDQACVQ